MLKTLFNNKYKLSILVCSISFFIYSFKLDLEYFTCGNLIFQNSLYLLTKAISLFFIIFLSQLPIIIYEQIKNKNNFFIKALKVFLPLFIVYSTILLLISPGRYTVDEIRLFNNLIQLDTGYWAHWYHILTSSFYLTTLEIFHSKISIVFVQITCICAYFSWFITKLTELNKTKITYLIPIILLTTPIINCFLCPSRISLYSYLFFMLISYKYIKYKENKELSTNNILIISTLSSLILVYRTEGIILSLLLPLCFLLLFIKLIDAKKLLIYISTLIIFSFSLYEVNTFGNNTQKYNSIPISFEISKIINNENAKISINDKEVLNKYIENREINSDKLAENISNNSELKNTLHRILVDNYSIFLQDRLNIFKDSSSIHGTLDEELGTGTKKAIIENLNKRNILYNPFLTIIFLLINLIIGLIKKDRFNYVLSAISLCYFTAVYLTAPVSYFDYYLPIYFTNMVFALINFIRI